MAYSSTRSTRRDSIVLLIASSCLHSLLVLCPASAPAAGTFIYAGTGEPILWHKNPVTWNLDRGPLGEMTESAAAAMVRRAVHAWDDVPTTGLRLEEGSRLRKDYTWTDVNGEHKNNWTLFVEDEFYPTYNPVILDNDGLMTDFLLGSGARYDVIGFAAPFSSGSNIVYAIALFNGRWLKAAAGDMRFEPDEYEAVVVHELGHFVGLDHSQINGHLANNGNPEDDAYVPVMFPTSSDDETYRSTPRFDDMVALSAAYPPSDGSFESQFGVIAGEAVYANGNGAPGANVVARKVDDRNLTVATSVTGYQADYTGRFRIPGLPPGEYEVWIEPIQLGYTGGSSVGPYSETQSGLSFTSPIQPEYYNGDDESPETVDNRCALTTVQVTAGQETEVNFGVRDLEIEDERPAFLLAYDIPEHGGVAGNYGSLNNQFAVVVNDETEFLTISAEPINDASLQIAVNRNAAAASGNYIDLAKAAAGETVYITFQRNSVSSTGNGPALESGTYFIDVVGLGTEPASYTLTASAAAGPEPTPTPVPPFPPGLGIHALDLLRFGNTWQSSATDTGVEIDFDASGRIDSGDIIRLHGRRNE